MHQPQQYLTPSVLGGLPHPLVFHLCQHFFLTLSLCQHSLSLLDAQATLYHALPLSHVQPLRVLRPVQILTAICMTPDVAFSQAPSQLPRQTGMHSGSQLPALGPGNAIRHRCWSLWLARDLLFHSPLSLPVCIPHFLLLRFR